jgi:excisionase family DNA binding protein
MPETTDWGLLTTEEAAALLGKSRWTVARYVKRQLLTPATIVGNGYLFRVDDIAALAAPGPRATIPPSPPLDDTSLRQPRKELRATADTPRRDEQ